MDDPRESTWKQMTKDYFSPLRKPWFWIITGSFATVMSSFSSRYITQTEEVHRRYNEIQGRTNVEFNYTRSDAEIYDMLDYLDANGVKVRDDTIRLSRGMHDFLDKLPF